MHWNSFILHIESNQPIFEYLFVCVLTRVHENQSAYHYILMAFSHQRTSVRVRRENTTSTQNKPRRQAAASAITRS